MKKKGEEEQIFELDEVLDEELLEEEEQQNIFDDDSDLDEGAIDDEEDF